MNFEIGQTYRPWMKSINVIPAGSVCVLYQNRNRLQQYTLERSKMIKKRSTMTKLMQEIGKQY